MSPRPRKASDDEIFAAAYRAMQRLGPAQITLAEIAAEAGVTAGALVQRFGSKRALLLTLMARAAESTREMCRAMRAAHRSPLAAIRAYGEMFAHMGESPRMLAHHLSWLQVDFTDPDFHVHARAQARATRRALEAWVAEAVAAGELAPDTDARALARALQVTVSGSLMTWAFFHERTATEWVRHDVDALLARYGAATRSASRSTRPRARR